MCYFITVAIAERAAAYLVDQRPEGLTVMPVANPSVVAQLPRRLATYMVVTKEMCSCPLFREEPSSKEQERIVERLTRKYRAKGWSASRIERALSQHSSDTGVMQYGLDARLVSFLSEVAERAGELRIVVHWYDGDITTERLVLSHGPTVLANEFRDTNPVRKTDQIYTVASVRSDKHASGR